MAIKTAAIIQARMGSSRLPGKTLAPIQGKPLLQHLIERLQTSELVDDLIIATTTENRDDELVAVVEQLGVKYFRGSEDDVLDRTYQAAKHFEVENIVRVTADCPLVDPLVVDRVIEAYFSGSYDYVTNTLTYPDGLDVEVFSLQALQRAWKETVVSSDREHVTGYLQNSGRFRVFEFEYPANLSDNKWSVDTQLDLVFVRAVFEKLQDKGSLFHLEDVLQILQEHPDLALINQRSVRDAGYYLSITRDPPVPEHELPISRSLSLKKVAERLIPSVTQTFSKGPTQMVQGVAPVFLSRGQGSHVWDPDGNEYIDYSMGLGAVVLGHNYPAVTEATIRQIQDGVSFSLPHTLELELAELLVELIPCAEMARFGKNGSDATSGAVRVARAFTGREKIACCGYHGWQDWYVGTTTRSLGVPEAVKKLTLPFNYNDISSLETLFTQNPGEIAAVIMEPIGLEEPKDGFLEQIQEIAKRNGALLIFDEIITGFRFDLRGVQTRFDVTPDLACFGKAMGNGFPISTVVGRRDVMELFDEVFFSFTFGGEAVSLAASVATIKEMQTKNVLSHIWGQGRKLKDGFNTLAQTYGIESYTQCVGLPPHSVVMFKDASGEDWLVLQSLFQQECLRRGVLLSDVHNLSYSHTDQDVDNTLRVYRTALEILAQAIGEGDVAERLDGKPVEPVFRPRKF